MQSHRIVGLDGFRSEPHQGIIRCRPEATERAVGLRGEKIGQQSRGGVRARPEDAAANVEFVHLDGKIYVVVVMHCPTFPGPSFKPLNLRASLNAVLCDKGRVSDGETSVSAEAAFVCIFVLRSPAPDPGRPEHSIGKLLVRNGSSDNDIFSTGDYGGISGAFEIYFRCLQA